MLDLRTFFVFYLLIMGNSLVFADCPHSPIAPYTDHLNVVSKYDPNDPTRSTPATPDPESEAIQYQLNQYAGYIARISDYYVIAPDTHRKQLALECLDLWLNLWANANALATEEINHTGYAVRSWALSTIASSSYQVMISSQNQWAPSSNALRWMNQLAYENSGYYYARTFQTPDKVNNHDYWAAWAATATGIITKDRNLLDWAYSILTFSLDQSILDRQTNTAYWPNEIGRARLGAYYSHFALSPVVAMAVLLPNQGYVLHQEQYSKLTQLAEFTATFTINPRSVQHINEYSQVNMNGSLLYWSKLYNQAFSNEITQTLESNFEQQIRPLPQLGGDISQIFVSTH
jgi:poly(beta-D-mannuronate) lyase